MLDLFSFLRFAYGLSPEFKPEPTPNVVNSPLCSSSSNSDGKRLDRCW